MGLGLSIAYQDWEPGTGKQGGFCFPIQIKGNLVSGTQLNREQSQKQSSSSNVFRLSHGSIGLQPLKVPPRIAFIQSPRESRMRLRCLSVRRSTVARELGSPDNICEIMNLENFNILLWAQAQFYFF